MERRVDINLPLTLAVSFCFHVLIIWVMMVPLVRGIRMGERYEERLGTNTAMRDIIVNANEDDAANENQETLLSEKDSSGKGFLTKQKGDTFLNNSLDFTAPKKASGAGRSGSSGTSISLPEFMAKGNQQAAGIESIEEPDTITIVNFTAASSSSGSTAEEEQWTKIPDKRGINLENAIFISNDGQFSFNTKKFTDFKYFKEMKNRISSHWFPPVAGNTYMIGEMNRYGGYTPGYTRIMSIPPQDVKLYFKMNRKGDVLDVVVVDSGGSQSLVDSCVDAVRNSKSFGNVPDDVKGEPVIINFMFGYYTR